MYAFFSTKVVHNKENVGKCLTISVIGRLFLFYEKFTAPCRDWVWVKINNFFCKCLYTPLRQGLLSPTDKRFCRLLCFFVSMFLYYFFLCVCYLNVSTMLCMLFVRIFVIFLFMQCKTGHGLTDHGGQFFLQTYIKYE